MTPGKLDRDSAGNTWSTSQVVRGTPNAGIGTYDPPVSRTYSRYCPPPGRRTTGSRSRARRTSSRPPRPQRGRLTPSAHRRTAGWPLEPTLGSVVARHGAHRADRTVEGQVVGHQPGAPAELRVRRVGGYHGAAYCLDLARGVDADIQRGDQLAAIARERTENANCFVARSVRQNARRSWPPLGSGGGRSIRRGSRRPLGHRKV